jgi:ATP-dependent RNA helicase DDX60
MFQIHAETRHLTIETGGSPVMIAARTAARSLLFAHLLKLAIPVHVFESSSDDSWIQYVSEKKVSSFEFFVLVPSFDFFCQPMFVMTNDGGVFQQEPTVERTLQAERILSQRIFVLNMLCTGTGITLLKGAEYRDSRVMPSFFLLFISNPLLRRSLPSFMNQNTLPMPISRFLKRLRIFMLDFYRNIVLRVLFSKR